MPQGLSCTQSEYDRHPEGAAKGIEKDDFLREHLLALPTWQVRARMQRACMGSVCMYARFAGALASYFPRCARLTCCYPHNFRAY